MIFDRTEQDVKEASRLREEKVKKFIPLSDEEKEIMERGFLTVNTINRIERVRAWLVSELQSMGYYNIPIISKEWNIGDIYTLGDFFEWTKNLYAFKENFLEYGGDLPNNDYHYKSINIIEKNLYLLGKKIEEVKSAYSFCGNFECGEVK